MHFDESAWVAYKQANLAFAQTIAGSVEHGDLIWIHDYHLLLLPAMLRNLIPSAKDVRIGFFLHTPFPCIDVFRTLPVAADLAEALLHSDLIGFHTDSYRQHFASTCSSLLDLDIGSDAVAFGSRRSSFGVFPIGIDPAKFEDCLNSVSVQARIDALRKEFHSCKILLGVDRLDYVKGLPQKLQAFEAFLTQHPAWRGKVVLVQVAVPSRENVDDYRSLIKKLNEMVGQINGTFGVADWMPIRLIHRSVDFHELVALYAAADACVISSTRDGMNLVAYEFIACQKRSHPKLILSEFTGAAESLQGCVRINPWDTEGFANALYSCLIDESDSKDRHLQQHVKEHTSEAWGKRFVSQLSESKSSVPAVEPAAKIPDFEPIRARLA